MGLRGPGTVTTGSSTAVLDTGTASGDIGITALSADFGGITMTNANWTQFGTTSSMSNDGQTYSLWWRLIDGTEGTKMTWTIGGGSDIVFICWAFTGRNTSSPITASAQTTETSGSSPFAKSLTGVTAATGDDVLAVWFLDTSDGGGAWTGGSYTSGYTQTSVRSFNWTNIFAAEKDNVSSGATGSISGTFTSSGSSTGAAGWVISLAAAGGGGASSDPTGGPTRDLLTGRLPHLRMAPKGFARRDRIYVPARLAA